MLANLVVYLFFTFGRTGVWEMEGRGSSGHFRRSEVDGVLLDELEAGMIRSNGKKFKYLLLIPILYLIMYLV